MEHYGINNLWWKRGLEHPKIGKKHSEKTKKKISEKRALKPNLQMNKYLAYFVGAFLGDGSSFINKKNGSYCVRIYPGQLEEFGNKCADCLKNIGLNPHIYWDKSGEKYGYKPQLIVSCYSKKLVEWLRSLTLDKLYDLLHSDELKLEFLRGFADAEGAVHIQFRSLRLSISNTDKELIDFVAKLLDDLGFHYGIHAITPKNKKWKTLYAISLTRNDEVCKLLEGMAKGKEAFRKQAEFKPSPMWWTEEEIRILKEEYPKGFREDLTNKIPNRSRQAIRAKAHELGIKRKPTKYTQEEIKDKLYDLYWNKNLSIDEIAKELNIGIATAWNYLKRFGIPLRNRHESRRRRATVELTCLHCKKKFSVMRWIAKKGRKFCSMKCYLSYITKS